MSGRALYCPGPSYHDPRVKEVAGWWRILEYQRQAMELAGYEVETPQVSPDLLVDRPSFARITSYGVAVASMTYGQHYDLVLGAPSYGYIPMLAHPEAKHVSYGWNNAPTYRNKMLEPEYAKHGQTYDHSPVGDLLYRSSLRLSDRIIACSPFVAHTHWQELVKSRPSLWVMELGPNTRVQIAPWGVDSETFRPGKKNDRFTVLFVGGDPIRKGLTYLVDALAGMEGEFEFWVAGCNVQMPPPYRNLGIIYYKDFGMVPYTQMPEIMARCHVLVLPSLEDGIALVVQEAMACGLVPVATPDSAEVFTHPLFVQEPCGYTIKHRSPEDIADKLKLLYEDRRLTQEMGEKARAAAEKQTWDLFKASFANIIAPEALQEPLPF